MLDGLCLFMLSGSPHLANGLNWVRESASYIFFTSLIFTISFYCSKACCCETEATHLCYLVTPYPDPQTRDLVKYNNSTRLSIEMTFGVIKVRFPCLYQCSKRACEVVAVCVVLYNIATIRKDRAH